MSAGDYDTALAALGTAIQDLAVIAETISTDAATRLDTWGVASEVACQLADDLSAPRVLRLMIEPEQTSENAQSLDAMLSEQSAALVGQPGRASPWR